MTDMIPATFRNSLERLRHEIDDTFANWRRRLKGERDGDLAPADDWFQASSVWVGGPSVEIEDIGDEIRVVAEIPGLDKDDFTVELSGNNLVLRGEKKAQRETSHGGVRYSECRYGAFSRVVPLPAEVEGDKVKAAYRNGVLRVTLPKTPGARGRRIAVSVA
jgi:HSP20 family protein